MKKLLIAFLFLLIALPAFGADVTLTWGAPDDSRITGYNAYCSTSIPLQKINCIETPDTQYVFTDLTPGTVYYFSATSHDDDGNESGFPKILQYTVPVDPVIETVIQLKAPITIRIE